MRTLILALALIFTTSIASASINSHNKTTINHITEEVTEITNNNETTVVNDDPVELGLKANIKLLNLTKKSSLGVELSKDFYRKNTKEGYAAYLTVNIDLTK